MCKSLLQGSLVKTQLQLWIEVPCERWLVVTLTAYARLAGGSSLRRAQEAS